jgi:hypothetical protein
MFALLQDRLGATPAAQTRLRPSGRVVRQASRHRLEALEERRLMTVTNLGGPVLPHVTKKENDSMKAISIYARQSAEPSQSETEGRRPGGPRRGHGPDEARPNRPFQPAGQGIEGLECRRVLTAGGASLIPHVIMTPIAEASGRGGQGPGGGEVEAKTSHRHEVEGTEVEHLFETILHRHGKAHEGEFYVNELEHNDRVDLVIREMVDLREYQKAHASNTSFVTGLFRDVLRRAPTSRELRDGVSELNHGETRDAFVQAFERAHEQAVEHLGSQHA